MDSEFVITGTPQSREAYGCMVRKGDVQLKTLLDETIAELQTSGSTLTGSWNADTVVTLSGLTSVGGTLAISMAGNTQAGQAGTATFGYINAMQINVVPEPSTALLIMLGGLAGLYARATRRATAG